MTYIIILFISLLMGPCRSIAMDMHQTATANEATDVAIVEGKFEELFEHLIDENDQDSLNNLARRVMTLWCDKQYRNDFIADIDSISKMEKDVESYFTKVFNEMFNSDYLVRLLVTPRQEKSIFLIALQFGREDLFIRLLAYDLMFIAQYGGCLALDANELNDSKGKRLIHYACEHGCVKALYILKLLNAYVTLPTSMGFTAMQIVKANAKLSKNVKEKMLSLLETDNLPEINQLNLDSTDLDFHNVVTQLQPNNYSGQLLRPCSSTQELISAWAQQSSSTESLVVFDPTPENVMDQEAVQEEWDNFPRTPTRSRASARSEEDATPEVKVEQPRNSLSDTQFCPISPTSPMERYAPGENIIWPESIEEFTGEVILPGQAVATTPELQLSFDIGNILQAAAHKLEQEHTAETATVQLVDESALVTEEQEIPALEQEIKPTKKRCCSIQ